MKFVTIQKHVVNTDHISAVGPITPSGATIADSYFQIYLLGAGTAAPLCFWGKGRSLSADRNKLLRAMGAVL